MTATELNDADDDPLYLPILNDLFDKLAGKKLGSELKEAARWVLVPLLDNNDNPVLTRDGDLTVLSVNEAAMTFGVEAKYVRRTVAAISKKYAAYRLKHGLTPIFGAGTPAQWQSTRVLQIENIETAESAETKAKRKRQKKASGVDTDE